MNVDVVMPLSEKGIEKAVKATGLARGVSVIQVRGKSGDRCSNCGLSTAVPGVRLDENGVCNECHRYNRYKERLGFYFRDQSDLEHIVEQNNAQKRSDIDCLLLFSGGKDSTYVLHQLVNMGLKVVTYTFDNGYISDTAFENIHRITKQLGVEHITATYDDMDGVFRDSLNSHATVCKGCFSALLNLSLLYADKRGINLIFNGLSRGQIVEERLKFFYDRNIFDPSIIEDKLAEGRRVYHLTGKFSNIIGNQLQDGVFERVRQIDFFRYSSASKAEIYHYLKRSPQGWEEPSDTGSCSSNCLINDVGIAVHSEQKGYSNYEVPTAWEVRLGHLDRESALKEVNGEIDTQRVSRILDGIHYAKKEAMIEHVSYDVYCVSDNAEKFKKLEKTVTEQFKNHVVDLNFIHSALLPGSPISSDVKEHNVEEPFAVDGTASPSHPTAVNNVSVSAYQSYLLGRIDSPDGWHSVAVEIPIALEPVQFRRAFLHMLIQFPQLRLNASDATGLETSSVDVKLPLTWIDVSAHTEKEWSLAVSKLPAFLQKKVIGSNGNSLLFAGVVVSETTGQSHLCIVGAKALMDSRSWHLFIEHLRRTYLNETALSLTNGENIPEIIALPKWWVDYAENQQAASTFNVFVDGERIVSQLQAVYDNDVDVLTPLGVNEETQLGQFTPFSASKKQPKCVVYLVNLPYQSSSWRRVRLCAVAMGSSSTIEILVYKNEVIVNTMGNNDEQYEHLIDWLYKQ